MCLVTGAYQTCTTTGNGGGGGGGANLTRETTFLADCGPWETNFVEIFVVVRPPPGFKWRLLLLHGCHF